MTKPVRIQRKRAKGWKMPRNTEYVGRGTPYGNPFRVGEFCSGGFMMTPKLAVQYYEMYLEGRFSAKNRNNRDEAGFLNPLAAVVADMIEGELVAKMALTHLRGKNLACWCPPGQHCHADVLLELANV